MKNATISADIIASTSLSNSDMNAITKQITEILRLLKNKFDAANTTFYGRLLKGDYIECYIENPQDALRVALLLKTGIKAYSSKEIRKKKEADKAMQLFRNYGVRVSIGIGEMKKPKGPNAIWRGEAIALSGRKIDEQKTANKDKVIIKSTLFFEATEREATALFSCFAGLLDKIINGATTKQSEVLFWKLLDLNEIEISEKLGVSQSAVNQHSTAVGWNAINQALTFYEQYLF